MSSPILCLSYTNVTIFGAKKTNSMLRPVWDTLLLPNPTPLHTPTSASSTFFSYFLCWTQFENISFFSWKFWLLFSLQMGCPNCFRLQFGFFHFLVQLYLPNDHTVSKTSRNYLFYKLDFFYNYWKARLFHIWSWMDWLCLICKQIPLNNLNKT